MSLNIQWYERIGLLNGNIDALCVIGRFLDIEGPTAVNRFRQAILLIELIEWENFDEGREN